MIYVLNIIFFASKYLLIGYSFLMIFFVGKSLNISHAALIALGPYLTFLLYKQLGLPLFTAIIFASGFTTIIGLLLEQLIYQPLRVKNVSSFVILILSLGIYIVLQNIISMIWGDDIKSFRDWQINKSYNFFGAHITSIQVIIILVCFVIVISILLFYRFSKAGIRMRAITSNQNLATIFGINVKKNIVYASLVGAFIASLSGILIAFDTDMTPTMGFKLFLYGIISLIIGGIGSNKGIIIGALFLSASQQLAAYYIDIKWIDAVTFIILILFLIWKPLGFSGQQLKKNEI